MYQCPNVLTKIQISASNNRHEFMEKVTFDNNQIPLHYQIADYLLVMLQRGALGIDEKIPPEEELRDVFGVSRTTVRHAFDHLLQKGLVKRKQGKGTFWTDEARKLQENKPSGINRQIFNITEETTVNVISKEIESSSPEVARFLCIEEGSSVMVFKRLRYIDGAPMSFTINYLPLKIGDQIETKHLESMTMLETLETICKIDLGVVEHEVGDNPCQYRDVGSS